jgi:hypothetical protein
LSGFQQGSGRDASALQFERPRTLASWDVDEKRLRAKHLANRESRFTKINCSRQRGNSR